MIDLLRAELRRLISRRSIRLLAALGLVAISLGAMVTFAVSHDDPARAARLAQQENANCEREQSEFREQEKQRIREIVPEGDTEAAERLESINEFEGWSCDAKPEYFDEAFDYAESIPGIVRGLSFPAALTGFMIAASSIGATWGTGYISTLLVWEPRRSRVYSAQVTVAALGTAVLVFALFAFLAVAFLPAGVWRGSMDGADGSFWINLAGVGGRSAALAGMFALLGAGAASIIRNTAGAVGAGLAYLAVIDNLLAVIFDGKWRDWLFLSNAPAFLGFDVYRRQPGSNFGGLVYGGGDLITVWRSSLLLSIYVSAFVLIAFVFVQRRDVT